MKHANPKWAAQPYHLSPYKMNPFVTAASVSSATFNPPSSHGSTSKPKKPNSAYHSFFLDERQNMGPPTEDEAKNKRKVLKKIAAKWRALDTPTRSWYELKASDERKVYEKNLEIWKEELKSRDEKDAGRFLRDKVDATLFSQSFKSVTSIPKTTQSNELCDIPPSRHNFGDETKPVSPMPSSCYKVNHHVAAPVSCNDIPGTWHDTGSSDLQLVCCDNEDDEEASSITLTSDTSMQNRINFSLATTSANIDKDFVDFVSGLKF